MESLTKQVTNLSFALVQAMADEKENILISPCSAYVILKMLFQGTEGETKAQMQKVLKFSKQEGPSKELKEALTSLLCNKAYEMTSSSGLFTDKKFKMKPEYITLLAESYDALAKDVDFKNNAESAIQEINQWVKKETKGKIENLLAPGSLDQSTCLAMLNTVYFKGVWEDKFDKTNTKDADFHLSKKEKKTVSMMQRSGKIKFAKFPEKKCTALELPYAGDICMILVVPDDIEGVKELHKNTPTDVVINWIKSGALKQSDVDLKCPKMEIKGEYDLTKALKSMGIDDLFKNSANLSGISDVKGLYVSLLKQSTCMKVEEEGTEAAAATVTGISTTSLPLRTEITINQPFLLYIIHKTLLFLLFEGIICSP